MKRLKISHEKMILRKVVDESPVQPMDTERFFSFLGVSAKHTSSNLGIVLLSAQAAHAPACTAARPMKVTTRYKGIFVITGERTSSRKIQISCYEEIVCCGCRHQAAPKNERAALRFRILICTPVRLQVAVQLNNTLFNRYLLLATKTHGETRCHRFCG